MDFNLISTKSLSLDWRGKSLMVDKVVLAKSVKKLLLAASVSYKRV